jgi:hypothetical protein
MELFDYFNNRFEDYYTNPLFVLVVFFLLFFTVIFSILSRSVFKENRTVAVTVSLIISFISVYYLRDLTGWIGTFNLLLTIAVIGIIFFIAKPFFKFLKRSF